MTTRYRVDGMTCNGCARSVAAALEAVAPGLSVQVDLESKTVALSRDLDAAKVRQAVEGAGFDFMGAA